MKCKIHDVRVSTLPEGFESGGSESLLQVVQLLLKVLSQASHFLSLILLLGQSNK